MTQLPSEDDYAPGGTAYRRLLIALPAAGLATFAPLYSPQGLLPVIGRQFGVSQSTAALWISAATVGLAASALVWSYIGDRIGRPQALKTAMLAVGVIGLLSVLMPSFETVLAVRFLQGLFVGAIPTLAMAHLSEQVHPRYIVVVAGAFVSGNTVGGLIGRLAGGVLGAWFGWRMGMGIVTLVSLLATAVFFVALPPARNQPISQGQGTIRQAAHFALAHLRDHAMVVIFAQGFLLFGGFIALYNYLAFRLEAPPFALPIALASLLFLAYLVGTVTSRLSGRWALRWGRRRVLTASTVVFMAGTALTLVNNLAVILAGLGVLTGGYFAAQAIAAGWAGARPEQGKAQATSLYNMAYYTGAGVVGWALGIPFAHFGWPAVVLCVELLALLAQLLLHTCATLRD